MGFTALQSRVKLLGLVASALSQLAQTSHGMRPDTLEVASNILCATG